jgi:hypothetical protein
MCILSAIVYSLATAGVLYLYGTMRIRYERKYQSREEYDHEGLDAYRLLS